MASCTAYIFEEDFSRLTTREVLHAYVGQQLKGGSLFGQWTSTGNPVVHFAMPFSATQSERDQMGYDLYDKFRICYIGEWRPLRAHGGNDCHEMTARGAPTRFLVLDVSKEGIVPFLFDNQASKGKGYLERLPGKNPFNKNGLFERSVPEGNYNPQRYRYPVQSAAAGQSGYPPARSAAPQPQEAVTNDVQWYSSDEGNEKLKKVLQDFTEIAFGGKVDMSRDTATQNISLSFTDSRCRKKWEVQFPAMFPTVGALLIENPGTPYKRPIRLAPNDKASKAVKNIISLIR